MASAEVVTIAMATAAATVTVVPPLPPFSPLFAFGVFLPAVLPLESLVFADVQVRVGLAVHVLVRGVGRPWRSSFFSSAPAELACASVSFEDEPSAREAHGPVRASGSGCSVDSTSWFAIRRASDRPIPALPPFVSPDAVVVVLAFCVA